MAGRSALINVMYKASAAASRRMMRDFGEVENLQVTRKGAADFVSQADPSGTRPGHAPELVLVLKTYNCRHFRCLCCFGPALALVCESFITYSMGYVKIL